MPSEGPAYWPIALYGDDAYEIRVEFAEPGVGGVDALYSVAGNTYLAQVRTAPETAGSPLVTLTVDMTEAVGGMVRVVIPPELVRGLVGYWDLQEQIGAAAPTTLMGGPVTWTSDTTR